MVKNMALESNHIHSNGEEEFQQRQNHADFGDLNDSSAGHRVFYSKDGKQFTYPIAKRAQVEAQICAGILGPGPLKIDVMVTEEWAKKVYSLPFRGVSRAGFVEYLAKAHVGTFTDPLYPGGHQATKKPFSVRIPSLFLDEAALAEKRPELQEYAKAIGPGALKNPADLEKIRGDLQAEKMKYFGTESVQVLIVLPTPKPRVNVNVRHAFDRLPVELKHQKCTVTREGTNLVPWEVVVEGLDRGDDGTAQPKRYSGTARTRKEARMMALVKRYYDPDFDGASPLADDAALHRPPAVPLPKGLLTV